MTSHTACSARLARTAFAALVAMAIAVPVSFAQVPVKGNEIRSLKVDYSDLNLASDEGSRVLYQRLVSAARHVCPEIGSPLELGHNRDARRCVSDAVARAAKEIKHPKFVQVAAAHTH